jgi:hypothetical protein
MLLSRAISDAIRDRCVVFADIMKGNLGYLADCTEAMSITSDVPGLYCDPFTLNSEHISYTVHGMDFVVCLYGYI